MSVEQELLFIKHPRPQTALLLFSYFFFKEKSLSFAEQPFLSFAVLQAASMLTQLLLLFFCPVSELDIGDF